MYKWGLVLTVLGFYPGPRPVASYSGPRALMTPHLTHLCSARLIQKRRGSQACRLQTQLFGRDPARPGQGLPPTRPQNTPSQGQKKRVPSDLRSGKVETLWLNCFICCLLFFGNRKTELSTVPRSLKAESRSCTPPLASEQRILEC